MKVAGASLFFWFFSLLLSSQPLSAQGINYETGTLAQVLAKASQAKKPVFINLVQSVDLSANLPDNLKFISGLEDAQVVQAYNEQFLNVLVLRSSAEGGKLAQQYGTTEYPTYLFLGPDGSLVHRTSRNSSSPERYLTEIKLFKGKLASAKNLNHFQQQFEQGNRSADFLKQYLSLRKQLRLPTDHALLEAYVGQLSVSAFDNFATVQFILEHGPVIDSKAYTFARSNKALIDSLYKTLPYTQRNKINNAIISNTLRRAIAIKDQCLAQKAALYAHHTWGKNHARGTRAYQSNMLSFYRSTKDTANYLREAVKFYDQYYMQISADSVKKLAAAQSASRLRSLKTSQAEQAKVEGTAGQEVSYTFSSTTSSFVTELNNAAYILYETGTTNPAYLSKALRWSQRTIEINPIAPYYDTMAHLLYRLQRFSEAEAAQQKAIDLAGKENPSLPRFRQSLEKMKTRTL